MIYVSCILHSCKAFLTMNGLEITSSYLAFKEYSIHLAILVTYKLNNKKIPYNERVQATNSHLVIRSNRLLTFLTAVGKCFLVAGNTVWLFFFKYVTTGYKLLVTLMAGKMIFVEVLIHGFCVFPRKY